MPPNGRRQREPAGRSPAPKAPARRRKAPAAPGRTTGGVNGARKKRVTGFHRTWRLAEVAGGAWGLRPRKPPLGARGRTGARKKARHGAASNGSACKGGRLHLGAWTTQASPRRARQSVVVAVLRIVTCDVDSAPYRAFFRAPPYGDRTTYLPKTAGGSASPKGEARRQRRRQGRAKRMPRQGGLRVGVGGRCNQTIPPTPPNTPLPQTSAAARARRAKPGAKRRQGRAKRMPRQGGLRVGVGGAVQTSRTTHPTQHPAPPNTRGSASPKGEARRVRAGKAEQSECRAREDYRWGWAGGVTKPKHPPSPSTTPQDTRGSTSRSTKPHVARFSALLVLTRPSKNARSRCSR